MKEITYRIVKLRSAINGIYHFRIDRVTKETGKQLKIEEYQLCRSIMEARNAVQKVEAQNK